MTDPFAKGFEGALTTYIAQQDKINFVGKSGPKRNKSNEDEIRGKKKSQNACMRFGKIARGGDGIGSQHPPDTASKTRHN